MSQRRTLHITNSHRRPTEQPDYTIPRTNDPAAPVEQDHAKDQTAQVTSHDALVMYVGCPSRLKLLGLHIGSAKPKSSRTTEMNPVTFHDDTTHR